MKLNVLIGMKHFVQIKMITSLVIHKISVHCQKAVPLLTKLLTKSPRVIKNRKRIKRDNKGRKLRSSKQVEILQVALVLRITSWKNIIFHGRKKRRFFLIFSMKSSSTAPSYLNDTLNVTRTFLHFLNINTNQTSKEWDLNFVRSNYCFLEQP